MLFNDIYTAQQSDNRSNNTDMGAEISKRQEGDSTLLLAHRGLRPLDRADDAHLGSPLANKSLPLPVSVSSNVTTQPELFAQENPWRGMTIFIDNSQLHRAASSFATERTWGDEAVSVDINAGGDPLVPLVLDDVILGDGTLSGHFNGSQIGVVSALRPLQQHPNVIDLGQANSHTISNEKNVGAPNHLLIAKQHNTRYNQLLSSDHLDIAQPSLSAILPPEVEPASLPPAGAAYQITAPEIGFINNSNALNTAQVYEEKTVAIAFTTAMDVTTRQVVYEQGGSARGLSFFIENSQLFLAMWNTAGAEWGYQELAVEIEAGRSYHATLLFAGTSNATGSFNGLLDGAVFGIVNGIGWLPSHTNGIGIGLVNGNTLIHGNYFADMAYFQGTVDELISYNRALESTELAQLDQYFASQRVSPPSAEDDTATLLEGAAIVLDVLANDSAGVGDPDDLTVIAVSDAENGNISLNDDGTITYTHNGDESRSDSFTYTVSNSRGDQDTATVDLIITNVNDRPSLSVDDITLREDTAVGEALTTATASDPDGSALTFSLGDSLAPFAIDSNTGVITLTGPLDFEARDSYVLHVNVSDGDITTTKQVSVTVTHVVEREDKPNIIAIIDSGYLPRAREYETLASEWSVVTNTNDASSSQEHGTIIEKSIWDITSDYAQLRDDTALAGVVHVRVTSDASSIVTTSRIEKGFQYVTTLSEDFDVVAVNVSFGRTEDNSEQIIGSRFEDEYTDLTANGTIITVAAGNNGAYATNYLGSTTMDGVLTVSALDTDGTILDISNEGDFTDYYALGHTTWGLETDEGEPRNQEGTSFAAPRVAGLVAVVQDMAEDVLGRLLDVVELTEVFDNVTDSIIGRHTGEAITTLGLDNVIDSFIDLYGDPRTQGADLNIGDALSNGSNDFDSAAIIRNESSGGLNFEHAPPGPDLLFETHDLLF